MRHGIVHFCRISSAVVALNIHAMFRYEIMTRCWHDDATTRPSFSDICGSIEQIVDSAEHLPLSDQSQHSPSSPDQSHAAARVTPQPSPTYSNFSFESDEEEEEEEDATPLYKNCEITTDPQTSAMAVA